MTISSIKNITIGESLDSPIDIKKIPVGRIVVLIENILRRRFNGVYEKTQVSEYRDRLSFACPYCLDSNDKKKKRGNVYHDTLAFHCYNCGYHTSLYNLLKYFSKDVTDEELFSFQYYHKHLKRNSKNFDVLNLGLINQYTVPRKTLMKKLGFVDVIGTNAGTYLLNRIQKDLDDFAYDPKTNAVIILNSDSDNNVLTFQKRFLNENSKTRYMNFTTSRMYEQLGKSEDIDFTYIDTISMIYNIMNINFNEKITVFEGAFDANLYYNSIALNGITKGLPFDGDEIQFWLDNDEIGLSTARKYLSEGYCVFLWGKYLKDNGIPTFTKIKDLTDLYLYQRNCRKQLKPFDEYFSCNKLDAYYL